tara:strand:- start:93 stop:440 length:348 start_codon:yes stop_codon:yes gene_type:complete
MNNRLYIIFLIFIYLNSCSNSDEEQKPIPECLKPTVESILSKPVQNPRADIEKWLYQGQEVYAINAQNFPDGESFIITLDCKETICTIGGFDGPLNDCEKFEPDDFIETIWTDPR